MRFFIPAACISGFDKGKVKREAESHLNDVKAAPRVIPGAVSRYSPKSFFTR